MSAPALRDRLLDALRAARPRRHPWCYASIPDTLPAERARALTETFPAIELVAFEERARDKTYRLRTARLDGPTAVPAPDDQWTDFLSCLSHPDYPAALTELTGVELAGTELSVSAWEYQTGDWLAPHLDKPEKVVTQIFYLTPRWQPPDGSRLLIMSGADPSTVVDTVAPSLGTSVVLVRSEHSWHAVEAPGPGAAPRRSVTATFWRPGAAPA